MLASGFALLRSLLVLLHSLLVTLLPILVLPLPPLLLLLLCVLPRLLREMRHMHATRGFYERLAATHIQMQTQQHEE